MHALRFVGKMTRIIFLIANHSMVDVFVDIALDDEPTPDSAITDTDGLRTLGLVDCTRLARLSRDVRFLIYALLAERPCHWCGALVRHEQPRRWLYSTEHSTCMEGRETTCRHRQNAKLEALRRCLALSALTSHNGSKEE